MQKSKKQCKYCQKECASAIIRSAEDFNVIPQNWVIRWETDGYGSSWYNLICDNKKCRQKEFGPWPSNAQTKKYELFSNLGLVLILLAIGSFFIIDYLGLFLFSLGIFCFKFFHWKAENLKKRLIDKEFSD